MLLPLTVRFLESLALLVIAAVALPSLMLLSFLFILLLAIEYARAGRCREDEADPDHWPIA